MSIKRLNSNNLTLSPNHSDSADGRTPQKNGQFSFPGSPKFPLKLLNDLQDQIREKELVLLENNKQKKILETENKELKNQVEERDFEISRLCEENFKLKAELRDSEYNLSGYWKKEVLRKNEGIKRYQEQVRTQEREQRDRIEKETRKLIEIFETEKKNFLIKNDFNERKIETLEKLLKDSEELAGKLKSSLDRAGEIDLEKKLQELELLQTDLMHENTRLNQEIEIIRRGNNLQELAVLSADIHRISRQVHGLRVILKNLKQGKELSLYMLLEMDEARVISSSRQLVIDVAQMKKDLVEIKEMISDSHAEIVSGNFCNNQ